MVLLLRFCCYSISTIPSTTAGCWISPTITGKKRRGGSYALPTYLVNKRTILEYHSSVMASIYPDEDQKHEHQGVMTAMALPPMLVYVLAIARRAPRRARPTIRLAGERRTSGARAHDRREQTRTPHIRLRIVLARMPCCGCGRRACRAHRTWACSLVQAGVGTRSSSEWKAGGRR